MDPPVLRLSEFSGRRSSSVFRLDFFWFLDESFRNILVLRLFALVQPGGDIAPQAAKGFAPGLQLPAAVLHRQAVQGRQQGANWGSAARRSSSGVTSASVNNAARRSFQGKTEAK